MPLFTSSLPWSPDHVPAMALYCSDDRFGEQTEEFLHQGLGWPRYDRFIVPGGAGCLALNEFTFRDYDVARARIKLLVDHHGTNTMVLIAHHDCGFYQVKMPGQSEANRYAAQLADLATARSVLEAWFAGIVVEAYYAHVRDEKVVFDEVTP